MEVKGGSLVKKGMKIHMGCGVWTVDGHINCDLYKTQATDLVFDAQDPWPVKDNSVSQVISSHFLEHLDRPEDYFRHAWSAMHDNGIMALRLPYGSHDTAWSDLTHLRRWHPASFCFLQPGYMQQTKNPQHRWSHFFAIDVVEMKIPPFLMACAHWPLTYLKLVHLAVTYLQNVCAEMYVFLRALKSEYTLHEYLTYSHKGNAVPIIYVKEWMRDKQLNIVT